MKSSARMTILFAACGLISTALDASCQEKTLPRVGFVAGAGGYPKMAVTNQAFFDGLAEAGYRDGSTMKVVFRTAEGNMAAMPGLIAEVLGEGVDYLVVSSSPGCAAAKKATTSVPILCISVQDDPIKEGFATTLAHGDGNLVGVHSYLPDGIDQQLSKLQELKPQLRTVGVLYNPGNATHMRLLAVWESKAASRGLRVVPMSVPATSDLPKVMQDARAQHVEIAIGLLGADTYAMRKEIGEAAIASRLPTAMDTPGGYTQMGGMATIGVDIVPLYRKGALEQMVPMLKGTKPSELSWIGPKEISMTVNDGVAKTFGITRP